MATTAAKFGTSFSGTGWSLLSNLGAFDNASAQSGTASGGASFNALDVKAPDFSEIGDTDPVTQLDVSFEAKYFSKVCFLNSIQLFRAGTLYGSTQGPSTNLSATDTVRTYTFDLTGAGWTGADLKDAGFGARLIFKRTAGKGIGSVAVDGVTFQATYTAATRSTWAKRKLTRGFKPTGKGF